MNYISVIENVLVSNYEYRTYYDPYGDVKKSIELGYVRGANIRYTHRSASGNFKVTDLGKTWLEFHKL